MQYRGSFFITKTLLNDWRNHHEVAENQLITAIVDPTVNLEIKELRLKLYDKEEEIRKLRDELQASNFAGDSVMGRRLINKCKALQEENHDLGKLLAEDRLQPLQMQIASLQKQINFHKHHMKQLWDLNADLDEENENLSRQLIENKRNYQTVLQEKQKLQVETAELKERLGES